MNQDQTLQELHAYLCKALKKAENGLDKHRRGIWNNAPEYIARAEIAVQKWARWRDLIAELRRSSP